MFREDGDENTIKVEFTTHDAIVILWGNGEISLEIQDMEADPSHE
ncbi:hypothetical protein SAMN04488067_10882 [Halorubrum xinjiangense]|uniref:Halobacterial output domain-containing protein n=2 Tax=Halorubrum xinjiangense TaxID=261291 RepID=A0A1G7NRT2_9EURY|nr:hypothetical protein SAMN04488067_10882 [Halorubrum xinjiangense]